MTAYHWLLASRPKTLPAAIAPVLVGSALAAQMNSFLWAPALLCLIFSLLIQIGTNFANDYFDWKQGADTETRIGPSRAVASGWIKPATMKSAMMGIFCLAFLFGLLLIPWGGLWLIIIGVVSIFSAYAYTAKPFALGYRGLGDIFVIIFFGWVAVGVTTWLQVGFFPWTVWPVGLSVGLLANNLLVLNNYRDCESDALAGKRTLVVRFGKGFGLMLLHAGWIIPMATAFLLLTLPGVHWSWLAGLGLLPILRTIHRIPGAKTAEEFQTLLKLCSLGLCLYSLLLFLALAASCRA